MTQRQYVEGHRKIMLRKRLLKAGPPVPKPEPYIAAPAAYVPFCGDGDIAYELYQDRLVYGVDNDPVRIDTARARLPQMVFRCRSADSWPFKGASLPTIHLADFDAYNYPYAAFRAFWENAKKAETLILFFTDGHRQGISRTGSWHKPDGTVEKIVGMNAKRAIVSRYYRGHILPWFIEYIRPYVIVKEGFYFRGMGMLYWGAIVQNVEK